jgi:NADPH-dependent curcumin reductase CurA
MLDAALLNMKEHGRIVICGSISQSNKSEPDPVRNLVLAPSKRLIIKGFLIADHQDRAFEFFGEMGRWIRDGKIIAKETVVEGIENSVDAFLGLFSGQNTGKMLVKLF